MAKNKKKDTHDQLMADTKSLDSPSQSEFPHTYATVYAVLTDLLAEPLTYIDQLTGRELIRLTNIKNREDEWASGYGLSSIVRDLEDILFILGIANRVGLGRFEPTSKTEPAVVKPPQKSPGDETLPPPFEKNPSKWIPRDHDWVWVDPERYRDFIERQKPRLNFPQIGDRPNSDPVITCSCGNRKTDWSLDLSLPG